MTAPTEIARILSDRRHDLSKFKVVTGFDGFVDEMITLVDERNSQGHYTRVDTIDQFGDLIKAAAGHSSLREIVVTHMDAGGCAVNMGDGLAKLEIPVTTFATVGTPIHKAFNDYMDIATLHSWGGEPGRTLAYEFDDGKLMFSAVSQFADFTPEHIKQNLSDGIFQSECNAADLIALTDWTLYPHMTACWQLLQNGVFSKFSHRPHLFLDLVDPSTRSESDIHGMLDVVRQFESNCRTTLGLNKNEANILSRILSIPKVGHSSESDGTEAQADAIQAALGISEVVIHAHKFAVSASIEGHHIAYGPFCKKPKKSTGAGDRFNSGYALGLLLNLPEIARLQVGTATSGLYVRRGHSPSLDELIQFFKDQTSSG